DLRRGAVNVVQVCLAELNGRRCDVLLQAMQLCRPWNRHDPGLLGKQPGECDLGERHVLPLSDGVEEVDQRPVRLPSFRCETRYGVPEIGAVKGGIFVDLARKVALPQGTEGNEADSELFERRNDLRFRLPPPKGVLTLKGGDGLNCMCATNSLYACFRKAEVLDLAFLDQVPHRSGHVL